jgi:hypothetical protein
MFSKIKPFLITGFVAILALIIYRKVNELTGGKLPAV